MSFNSDQYNFLKSEEPQGIDINSPYVSKNFLYVQDNQQGSYTNSGLNLVEVNLRNIISTGKVTDTADMFYCIPTVTTAAVTNAAGAVQTAPVNGVSLISTKSNYQHLIHQVECQVNGQTVSPLIGYSSMFNNFKMLSKMSLTDLQNCGTTWNIDIDSPNSCQFNTAVPTTAATVCPGLGLTNNIVYQGTSAALGYQSYAGSGQNSGTCNDALQRRQCKFVDVSTAGAAYNKIFGAQGAGQPVLLTTANIVSECRPYYSVTGNIMAWYDVAIIPLKYLIDFCDKAGLTSQLDMTLKFYINTGSVVVPLTFGTPTAVATPQYGAFTSSFSGVCPLMVNMIVNGANGLNDTTNDKFIVAQLNIAKASTSPISVGTGTINLGNGIAGHTMSQTRVYYSSIELQPSRLEKYLVENRNKMILYENLVFNSFSNISPNSGGGGIINASVKNPIALLAIPFISTSCPVTYGSNASVLGFSQYSSPYDTAPSTCSPCILNNIMLQVGSNNLFSSGTLPAYTFEMFIQQVSGAERIMNELSSNCGLINQRFFEMNKFYYFDISRARDSDKLQGKQIVFTFTNGSNVPVDVLVFVAYSDSAKIDVVTGLVTKL